MIKSTARKLAKSKADSTGLPHYLVKFPGGQWEVSDKKVEGSTSIYPDERLRNPSQGIGQQG